MFFLSMGFFVGVNYMANGNGNGRLGKWALGILATLTVAWIIAVSGGLIRAEIRETRLCAIEKMVESLDKSVEDLSTIRDQLKKLVERLDKEHEE